MRSQPRATVGAGAESCRGPGARAPRPWPRDTCVTSRTGRRDGPHITIATSRESAKQPTSRTARTCTDRCTAPPGPGRPGAPSAVRSHPTPSDTAHTPQGIRSVGRGTGGRARGRGCPCGFEGLVWRLDESATGFWRVRFGGCPGILGLGARRRRTAEIRNDLRSANCKMPARRLALSLPIPMRKTAQMCTVRRRAETAWPLGDAARRPLRPCAAGGSGSGSGGGYLMGYLREDLHTPPHTTNASHRTHHAQDSNAAATTPDQKQDVSTANVVLMCSSAHPIEDRACMVTVKYKPSDQQLNNASSFKGHHRRHSRLYSEHAV